MSKEKSKDSFKLGFKHFVRILIFIVVFTFLTFYLSTSETKLPVSNITSSLNFSPEVTRYLAQKQNQLLSSSVIIQITDQKDNLLANAKEFIQKQIKDIKKQVITQVYQDILKSIEQ